MKKILSHVGSEHKFNDYYAMFAEHSARICGKSLTFILSCVLIIVWAALGPYYQWSDSYQLVINTGTTIFTFLMVFLLQNTQNRDTEAIQKKLDVLLVEIALLSAEKTNNEN